MKRKILSTIALGFMFCGVSYSQTYTFTNAGVTGMFGPTQAQVNAAYSATNLNGNVTINTQGIQEWTVPASGNYSIQALGAQGGISGGNGASIYGEFNLTAGNVIHIAVGQKGSGDQSGGGGTFIYNSTTSTFLSVAGGGGGGINNINTQGQAGNNAMDGTTTSIYSGIYAGKGGINGGGGGAGSASDNSTSGGAGGNGTDGSPTNGTSANAGAGGAGVYGRGGNTYNSSNLGGEKWSTFLVGGNGTDDGGFGGGGSGQSGHGGGGGYSGGGGGSWSNSWTGSYGGGAGSLNIGSNQTNITGSNASAGQAVLTYLCNPTTITLDQNNLPNLSANCSSSPVPPTATTDCGSMNGSPDVALPITTPGTTTLTWTFDIGNGNPLTQTQDITITSPTGSSVRTACPPVTIHGNVYNTSQIIIDTLVGASAQGCDSIHTTDLTINNNYAYAIANQESCDFTSLYGNTYYSSQVIFDTIIGGSVNGCDTITEMHLTINNSESNTNDYYTCSSSYYVGGATRTSNGVYTDVYTGMNGCDSIVATNLTLNAPFTSYISYEEICQGESFVAGGVAQTIAGTYYDTIVSGNGCDSLFVTNLSVLAATIKTQNVTINQGESYTFDGTVLTETGTYNATSANPSGCTNRTTLNLTVLNTTSIDADELEDISLYPNPTRGQLTLERTSKEALTVDVVDLSGKVLSSRLILSDKVNLDLSGYESGMYLVTIKSKDKVSVRRITLK